MDNIITYELARIAQSKGFEVQIEDAWNYTLYKGTEDEAVMWTNKLPNEDNPDISDIRRIVENTYHELIDWVFNINPKTMVENITRREWLEFWYNHLKDCPLKYEFKGRLLEWFKSNNYFFNINADDLDWFYDLWKIINTKDRTTLIISFAGYKTHEEAEHAGIKRIFKLLKDE